MASPCDVAIDGYHKEVLADIIVRNLGTKGFCTIDAGLTQEQLNGAVADCLDIDHVDRFFTASDLIADGLLGKTGSARVAHLYRPDALTDSAADGEHISLLDSLMSEVGECVSAEASRLGFATSARTPGLLHETGLAGYQVQKAGVVSDISETEASEWMVQFLRAKIMCIVFLGPVEAKLEMRPFNEKEKLEIALNPGDVVLLLPDRLSHTLRAAEKAHSLSCFFLGEQSLSSKRSYAKELSLTPVARNLHDWIENRLATYKLQDEDDEAERPNLPRSWLRAMNTCYYTGQRTCIQGSYCRYPGAWDSRTWSDAAYCGPDYATEIPLIRWDVNEFYDAAPDGWKRLKSYNRHTAFVDGMALFENKFFGLSPAEAKGMDPQQRWTLEGGYTALHVSGYRKKDLMNSFGGVYISIDSMNQWCQCPKDDDGGATGGANSICSNRFSFCLGMKGPSYTLHAEQAGSHLAIHQGCQGVGMRGRYVQPPFALVGGLHTLLWYGKVCTDQAMGVLSEKGRCFSFDARADGFIRSDGAAWAVLCPQAQLTDGKLILKDVPPEGGSICGSDVCQNGNISFNQACGPALSEVFHLAMRAARLEPCDMDAIDCHASGIPFADAIEVTCFNRALENEDRSTIPILSSLHNGTGNQMEAGGMSKIISTMLSIKRGTMKPTIGLRTLNPYIASDWSDGGSNVSILTEALEFRARSAHVGVLGYGAGGTNVFLTLAGEMSDSETKNSSASIATTPYKEIAFWPAGGGELEASFRPKRDYQIAGTMTNWKPETMTSKGGSQRNQVFSYTVTLGENRWEAFQIWLDGDEKRSLHPGDTFGMVHGPDEVDRNHVWKIDGRPGFGWTEDTEPVEFVTPDTGLIGTKYNVTLRIAGKYRTVEWQKSTVTEKEFEELSVADLKGSEADYFLYSSAADGLQKMSVDTSVVGQFYCDVRNGRSNFDFQILRNADWNQVIYPLDKNADETSRVCGPDGYDECRLLSWRLRGLPGDMRIYFRRTSENGQDSMLVWWQPR